ncbi:MAG TPA: hypothetical protein VGE74_21605 [Gemmata sp.]
MSPERAQPNDPTTPPGVPAPVPEPAGPPLEGVLTAEDIREIEASGLTLGDVIRELEAKIAPGTE